MKKFGIKLLLVILTIAFSLVSFSGCTSRTDTLKIYNWGEYIDETVCDSFVEWYADNNDGRKIKVEYFEYDSNETMYNGIEMGDSWDLVCPSDYMIDKMITKGLAMPLEDETVAMYKEVALEQIQTNTAMFDSGADGNYYSVPYIWGTFGIMFNSDNDIALDDVTSWSALWDSKYSGEVSMKAQVRDSYAAAILYVYRDELLELAYDSESGEYDYTNAEYRALLEKLFTEFDDIKLDEAKTALTEQKSLIWKYEDDNGKMDMADNIGPSLGLYWSCDAGFVINDMEDGDEIIEGNKSIGYYVPDEGSNLWIDGWVIPTTAKSADLANAFIRYTMSYDIAILNSEYAGATAVNAEAMADLEEEYASDEEFFEGTFDGFKEMYLDMRFPSDETLQRCAVMGDFGDEMSVKMTAMFENIKM